ncbi:MAG: hypothetical protein NTZ38_03430 [Candidatus Taylorbacteria bacterium]|nr:hypothetical protein [Candidatus Taylorbacteria bacterium]
MNIKKLLLVLAVSIPAMAFAQGCASPKTPVPVVIIDRHPQVQVVTQIITRVEYVTNFVTASSQVAVRSGHHGKDKVRVDVNIYPAEQRPCPQISQEQFQPQQCQPGGYVYYGPQQPAYGYAEPACLQAPPIPTCWETSSPNYYRYADQSPVEFYRPIVRPCGPDGKPLQIRLTPALMYGQ